jgi:hypothetical protein
VFLQLHQEIPLRPAKEPLIHLLTEPIQQRFQMRFYYTLHECWYNRHG